MIILCLELRGGQNWIRSSAWLRPIGASHLQCTNVRAAVGGRDEAHSGAKLCHWGSGRLWCGRWWGWRCHWSCWWWWCLASVCRRHVEGNVDHRVKQLAFVDYSRGLAHEGVKIDNLLSTFLLVVGLYAAVHSGVSFRWLELLSTWFAAAAAGFWADAHWTRCLFAAFTLSWRGLFLCVRLATFFWVDFNFDFVNLDFGRFDICQKLAVL